MNKLLLVLLSFFALSYTNVFAISAADFSTENQYCHYKTPTSERKLLNKDSLVMDIDLLQQALTEMHPGLYRYNTPEQINMLFKQLKDDLPIEISEGAFMIRLAQVIKQIKCGHTYLNPWNLNSVVRKRLFGNQTYFPMGFTVSEGGFFITENASDNQEIQRGAEILKINGVRIEDIYNKLKSIAKTDGNNTSPIDHYLSLWNYEVRSWHAFDIYYPLFYPLESNSFEIQFRNFGEDKARTIKVPSMNKSERAEKMETKYGSEVLKREEWSLDILSDDLAILRLGTFAIWNWKGFDQRQWFADAFNKLDSLNIGRLAVDIRGNGGGLAEPANELISYLIQDTLKCNDLGKTFIRTTKFNPDLLPYIDTWVEILKQGLPESMYAPAGNDLYELLVPSECSDIAPKENRFDGEIYIFGDASNVSATYTLLDKANEFGFASYIGQESGGNQQGINGGEYAFFTMPYSMIEVDIPLKYFAPKSQKPDSGVKPKVQIQINQKNIAENSDPYIEYLKK